MSNQINNDTQTYKHDTDTATWYDNNKCLANEMHQIGVWKQTLKEHLTKNGFMVNEIQTLLKHITNVDPLGLAQVQQNTLKLIKEMYLNVNLEEVIQEYHDILNKEKKVLEQKQEDNINLKILTLLLTKKRNEATELLTQNILKNNYIYTTRDDEKSEVWIYDKGIYIPQGRTFIKEFCRDVLGEAYTTSITNQIISKIEVDTFIDQKQFFTNHNKTELAVNNGILNVITKELKSFDPKKIFFNKLPVDYDPKKECPNILEHFKAVLKNKEDLPVIQEIIGYLLIKEYTIEKAIMFSGSGRNGKGKTQELMKHFIGIENCASVPLQQFENDIYSKGELLNKLANLSGDISGESLKQTGAFKELTGRDLISAPRKFLPRVHFINYAKLIFNANELPKTYDMTPAFWNRWVLLEFPYRFLSQKEIDNTPENERENIKLANPDIIGGMTSPDELSGLLNWGLGGLARLLKQKDFSYNKSVEEVKNLWVRKSNSFAAFLMDCVVESSEGWVSKNDLRVQYAKYCNKFKIKPESDKSIKYTLLSTFAVGESKRPNDDGDRVMVWDGIVLKSVSESNGVVEVESV